jgi:hypothetical protein
MAAALGKGSAQSLSSRWLFRASKEEERPQTTANYAWFCDAIRKFLFS